MSLPNRANVLVEHDKVVNYLLNAGHPEGAGKARLFLALGFKRGAWQVLAAELRRIGQEENVTQVVESAHGRKYIVDGVLPAPNGQTVKIRTVWIMEPRETRPRPVTAYPREE